MREASNRELLWAGLDPARLQPDTRHVYDLAETDPLTLIRLDAFPDEGLSRVRLIGAIDQSARRTAGYRWFNALPASQAVQCLTDAGLSAEVAAAVVAQRPLSENWLGEQVNSTGAGDIAIMDGLLAGRRAVAFRGVFPDLGDF